MNRDSLDGPRFGRNFPRICRRGQGRGVTESRAGARDGERAYRSLQLADGGALICAALQLGAHELARRAELLQADEALCARLIRALLSTREKPEESIHIEKQLYSGFFSDADSARLNSFHRLPWEERPAIVAQFEDRRLRLIGRRLLYVERPELLSVSERAECERAIAKRLAGERGDEPWLTLPKAIIAVDDLLASAEGAEQALLQAHRAHLIDRQSCAVECV